MSEIQYGAQWSAEANHDRMSPALQQRCAMADAQYDREAAVQEREREVLRAQRREDDIVLSIRQAEERGELVNVRQAIRDGGVGHTRGEFVALASARMDLEDAQERGREQARIRKFLADGDGSWADTSAPTPAESAEMDVNAARAASYRAKRRENGRMLDRARVLARMDRDSR